MYNKTINRISKYKNWNLDDIYPLDQFESEKNKLQGEVEKLLSYWSEINPGSSLKDFNRFIKIREKVIGLASQLISRLELGLSTNQKDSHLRKLKDVTVDSLIEIDKKLSNIERWLAGLFVEDKSVLDSKNTIRLFRSVPDMEYFLNRKRIASKYFLENREEEIVDNKDNSGLNSLLDLRNLLINDYRFNLKSGKNKKKSPALSQSDLMSLTYHPDRKERTLAYKLLLTKYKSDIDKHFLTYQSVIKDSCFESKLRGYKNPISVNNFDNDIPDDTVDLLLNVTRKKKDIFIPFFQFRAKQIGVKKFSRFDTHAPINVNESNINFEQAKSLILEVLKNFGPKFHYYGEKVFESNHIDYFPSPNKQIGAYCETINPVIIPYVFVNYYGKVSDVFVLAHEIGHAIHSLYSNHLSQSVQEASIPLSETASTLVEIMVFEYFLTKETDPKVRESLITQKLTETYAMIIRKLYLVEFESEAYKEVSKGTDPEDLSQIYFDTLKEQYGKNVDIDPIFRYEWACIRHLFEFPFYNYAYIFGELLSYSLYARYKQEGRSFVPKIEMILSSGGSKGPNKVLSDIGIDITNKETWLNGFRVIEDLINSLVN